MLSIQEGVRKIIDVCTALKSEETVLIITDDNKKKIAEIFRQLAQERMASVVVLLMYAHQIGGQEPPKAVAAAMCNSDVIYAVTTYSISQTEARMKAMQAGARMFNLPGVQPSDLTSRMINADFVALAPIIQKLADRLTQGSHFTVTTPGGTKLAFDAAERKGRVFDGLARESGVFKAIGIEANIGPLEGTADGVVVIDASLPDVNPLDAPIRCTIEKGKIVEITGGKKAEVFAKHLSSFNDPNIYTVAELGIGMNPCARVTQKSYQEDESSLGTCHTGFGTNLSQGGHTKAAGHVDGMMFSPTILVDGEVIMSEGKLLTVSLERER